MCNNTDLNGLFWETIARNTKWGKYVSDIEKDVILRANEYCIRKNCVLEVGCEGGRWLKMLENYGWENINAIEIDKKSLEICQRRLPNAKCLLVSTQNKHLPLPDNSADLLLTIEVIPVIHSDWFYEEAHRVLDKDGILVGVLHNKHSLRGFLFNLYRVFKDKPSEYNDSYRKSYRYYTELMEKTGLEILYDIGFCWFPFGRFSNSPFIPFFVFLERILKLNKILALSPWIAFIAKKR